MVLYHCLKFTKSNTSLFRQQLGQRRISKHWLFRNSTMKNRAISQETVVRSMVTVDLHPATIRRPTVRLRIAIGRVFRLWRTLFACQCYKKTISRNYCLWQSALLYLIANVYLILKFDSINRNTYFQLRGLPRGQWRKITLRTAAQ
jgi:hypothetical protein